MDALSVGAEIGGILGGLAIVVGLTIWVWRWREQTQRTIEGLNSQAATLRQAVAESVEAQQASEARVNEFWNRLSNRVTDMQEDIRSLRDAVAILDTQSGAVGQFEAKAQPILDDLQKTVLKLQAAQVRSETEQQQALGELGAEIAALRVGTDNTARARIATEGKVKKLEQQVADLSKGYWPSIGRQKVE